MAGRIFAGLVVVFWGVMMVALVRWEVTPRSVPLQGITAEQILQRVFRQTEPAKLTLLYTTGTTTNWVGTCRLDINPVVTHMGTGTVATTIGGYRVSGDLKLDLVLFGFPSRLQVVGDAQFDTRYELERFHIKAEMADGRIELRSDDRQRVIVRFDLGELHDRREFDLRELRTANLGGLGLPGLTPLARNSGVRAAREPFTVVRDHLPLAHGWLRCFLLEYRWDERTRFRAWISDLGEILRVDTPWGLTMLDDALVPESVMQQRNRARPVATGSRKRYDSH